MATKSGLIGSLALLAYLFTFFSFPFGLLPVYLGLLSMTIGVPAQTWSAWLSAYGRASSASGVMTALPVTFVSLEAVSGELVFAHFYVAGVSWLGFLGLSWVRRLPFPASVLHSG